MKTLSARHKVLLASALAHGLLIVLLSPFLTLAAGAGALPEAEVRCDLVALTELTPEPAPVPDLLPPPPEDPLPAEFIDTLPPEDTAVVPSFDRPVETRNSTELIVPRERSIAVRSARRPKREPAPQVTSAPPYVGPVAVSAPVRHPLAVSRRAVPVQGNPPPRYPARARERAHQGVVVVEALLDREGNVLEVKLLSSSGYILLDREALRTVGTWHFRPALRNGVPIASRVEQPIRFRIT